MPKLLRRILLFSIPALLVIAAILITGVTWHLRHSLPDYAGEVTMPKLSGPVHVYRDEYGVPHIFASTMNDAVRALGYVHASERMFQMEMQRRAGQGRLAEVLGSSMLDVDKFTRTMGFYHLAQSSFDALSPEAKTFFEAYAEGVNDWLDTHKHELSPDFLILGITPEPWSPVDSVVWGKLMGFQLSHNYKLEMLRAELAQKLSPSEMSAVFPQQNGAVPITINPHSALNIEPPKPETPETEPKHDLKKSAPKHEIKKGENGLPDAFDKLAHITGLDHAASNEWVVAGWRTASGKPLLANDPHLGLEAPILWYLARIVTPELSVKGATVPGLPIMLLGQNDHIAWGFTTTGSDVEDLFIETIDADNQNYYLAPGGSKPFDVREEVIKVKHGFDVKLQVRTTRHGPVLSDIDDQAAKLAGEGKVMVFAFAGLGDRDTSSEALMRLNRATNWNSFKDALKLYQTPPQNVVYADTAGNIGYINPGLVPVRKSSNGVMPVDGASGTSDWIGMIPFTQIPQIYNPPAGFVFNANNAVTGPGQLYFLGVDWEEPYRSERLQQFFDTVTKHDLDTSAMMQADHVSMAARELLPYLLAVKPSNKRAADAMDLLRNWDGTMDKDRPEPLIFDAWMLKMRRMLAKQAGNPLKERGPYMASSLNYIIANHASEWCGDALENPAPDCNAAIAKALDDALDMLNSREHGSMSDWRWGNESITLLKNKFYSHFPILSGKSDLSISSGGDFYTLDRGGSFVPPEDKPFVRTHAGGFRGLYDLDDPDQSRFMIATGESGHILSHHYGDLTPLWNDVKSFTLSGKEEDLQARNLPVLVFNPPVTQ